MQRTYLYLILCVAGAVVPMIEFVPWVAEHGMNLPLMVRELFSTRIGAFFGLDVVVSAVVLFVFLVAERIRRWWAPVLATCLIGVSCGLPLALYLRERQSQD